MRARTDLLTRAAAFTVAVITWATALNAAAADTANPGAVAQPFTTRSACPSVAPPKATAEAKPVVVKY